MKKKNIVYIYADDLGRGMLSCYGQKIIKTTNIDALAERGMRFTNFCGTAFCAPARASLICGIHDAHAGRWTYSPGAYYKKISTGEVTFEELQEVLQAPGIEKAARGEYLAATLKKAGYVTGEIGKLEWGFSTTAKEMEIHGWDYHYGYYDHIRCHGYYPPFLFENGEMVSIEGNTDPHCGRPEYKVEYEGTDEIVKDMTGRAQYSQDLFDEKILEFIDNNKEHPFFLFHPSQLPHGVVFYPEVHEQVKERSDLTQTEKEYASMVLRLDETVGKIVAKLTELDLLKDTLIIFAADNGHVVDYQLKGRAWREEQLDGARVDNRNRPFRTETCGDVFNGNDSMAGLKFSNWNGGCVIPFIASCPGLIKEGSVCDALATNYDTVASLAEFAGIAAPEGTDGISYMPLLRQDENPVVHDYVIYSSKMGPAIVTKDGWKLRVYVDDETWKSVAQVELTTDERVDYQLYNLQSDFKETCNLAEKYPEKVAELKKILVKECDGSLFNGTPMAHRFSPTIKPVVWKDVIQNVI